MKNEKERRSSRGIRDLDNPEWSREDFARARPANEVFGPELAAQLVRKGGRPPKPPEERKQQVTMRLAPDLLAAMRGSGPGWQTRAERILTREFLKKSTKGEGKRRA